MGKRPRLVGGKGRLVCANAQHLVRRLELPRCHTYGWVHRILHRGLQAAQGWKSSWHCARHRGISAPCHLLPLDVVASRRRSEKAP